WGRGGGRGGGHGARAVGVGWGVGRHRALAPGERGGLLRDFDAVLGRDLARALPRAERRESAPRIDARVAEREAARRRRDFSAADQIRDELAAEGIALEDTPSGPRWRREAS